MNLTYNRFLPKVPRSSRFPVMLASALVLSLGWNGSQAQISEDALPQGAAACGSLENGTAGPYDYRDGSAFVRRQLHLVNLNHFSQNVQTLKAGQTTVYVLGDLDFLLRHFPNHYPALRTTSRYFVEGGSPLTFRTAECYFDRAMRFVPDDLQVRLLFAIHLQKKGRLPDAIEQMERAFELSPGPSMELHYNIALMYADAKNFDKANYHASVAYAMGHPLPGLREKLQRLGQWRPVPVKIDDNTAQPQATAASAKTNP